MDEYVIYEGTIENIYQEMKEDYEAAGEPPLSREDCIRLVQFIQENKGLLDKEDLIQCTLPNKNAEGISEFITEQTSYYINLKQSSIYLMLFLLGIPTKGAAAFIAGLCGLQTSGRVVISTESEPGLKCIIMELARNRKRGTDENMLKKFHGECCNNHYTCSFRKNGSCSLQPDQVKDILENLAANQAVKKKFSRYYYQF